MYNNRKEKQTATLGELGGKIEAKIAEDEADAEAEEGSLEPKRSEVKDDEESARFSPSITLSLCVCVCIVELYV